MALKDFLNEQGVLDPAKLRQNKAIMGAIPKLISGNYSTQLEALDLLKKEGLTPESIMGALVQAPPAAKVTPAAPAPAPAAAATPAATPAAAAPTAPAAPAAGAPPRNAFTEGAPLMDDRIDQFGRVTPGVQTFANDAIKAARAAADAASNYAKANPGDTAGIEAARKTASAASQRAQAASMWASMSPGARQQAYSAGERATQFWNAQQQGQAAVREIQTDPQLAADLAYYNQTGVLRGAEGAGTAATPGGGTVRATQDGARVLTSPYGTGSATFGAPPSAARTIEGVPAMEWFKRNAETTGRGNKFFTASGDPIAQPVPNGAPVAAAPVAPAAPAAPAPATVPPVSAQTRAQVFANPSASLDTLQEGMGDVFQNTRTTGAVRMQNPQSISSAIQGTGLNSPIAPTGQIPSRTGEGLPNMSYQFDVFGNATPNPQRFGQPGAPPAAPATRPTREEIARRFLSGSNIYTGTASPPTGALVPAPARPQLSSPIPGLPAAFYNPVARRFFSF